MDQCDFEPIVHQHLAVGLSDALGEVKHDTRIAAARFRQKLEGERRRPAERCETDGNPARKMLACRDHVRMGLFHLPQDDLCVAIDLGAGVRHDDTLLASDQELRSEVFLECRELLAERRLCNVEYIGCSCDAAGINDHNKRFETPDIHPRLTLTFTAGQHCYSLTVSLQRGPSQALFRCGMLRQERQRVVCVGEDTQIPIIKSTS